MALTDSHAFASRRPGTSMHRSAGTSGRWACGWSAFTTAATGTDAAAAHAATAAFAHALCRCETDASQQHGRCQQKLALHDFALHCRFLLKLGGCSVRESRRQWLARSPPQPLSYKADELCGTGVRATHR
ncbi:hypothetical protein [Bradyrhizobium sp. I1.14.4]|uniref:hypothetical protein n=1 Tax=unclassified Bradyrhizobium TaxID=2631580 RepID=UPI003D1C9DA6